MLATSTDSHTFQSKFPPFQNLMTQFPPLTCHCTLGTGNKKYTCCVLAGFLRRTHALGLKVTDSLLDSSLVDLKLESLKMQFPWLAQFII